MDFLGRPVVVFVGRHFQARNVDLNKVNVFVCVKKKGRKVFTLVTFAIIHFCEVAGGFEGKSRHAKNCFKLAGGGGGGRGGGEEGVLRGGGGVGFI